LTINNLIEDCEFNNNLQRYIFFLKNDYEEGKKMLDAGCWMLKKISMLDITL